MATSTTPALFRFQPDSYTYPASSQPTFIEHTHPVPTFLTQPSQSQQGSQAFASAYIDTLSIITARHHDQCMTLLANRLCPSCSSPSTDCLKTPTSYLHLEAQPMVVVTITPTCGSRTCDQRIRAGLLKSQKEDLDRKQGDVWSGKTFGEMECDICRKEGGKRCAGCGTVAYCGRGCQKAGWKKHKRYCERKGLGQDLEGLKGPVEMI